MNFTRNPLLALAITCVCYAAFGVPALLSAADGYAPAVGPFSVDEVAFTLQDKVRGKELPLKVRYPQTTSSLPVVIFSHGYTYDQTAFGALSEYWAQHGYVVIHPTHVDAKVLTSKTGKPVRMANPAIWAERAGDISFVINSLEDIAARLTGFEGTLDQNRIGVGGHSFGAYTSMLIGGVTVELPDVDSLASHPDERAIAILPIAGQGRGQQGLHDHSWDELRLPMMMITGMNDRGLKKEEPKWRAEGFQYSPKGDKYWAFVEGASHFSYDCRPGGERQQRINAVVKSASLAFWDAYLRENASAKDYLTSHQILRDHVDDLEFSSK